MPLTAVSLLGRGEVPPRPCRCLLGLGMVPDLPLSLPLLPYPLAAVPTAASHALIYPHSSWCAQLLPPLVGPER